MKLYWGPHSCAIGTHVLLEEIGKPYETEKVDVMGGGTRKPEFLAVNPKGKVPVLVRDDGSALTEYGAIALWLARANPDKHLVPADPEAEARALEILDYAVGTLHAQAFGRIFMPQKFEPKDVVHGTLGLGKSAIVKEGESMVHQGFEILSKALGGKPYAGGDTFGIADTALFYVENWAPQVKIDLPSNLAAHLERMKARPAVKRVMAAEGEA